MTDSTEQLTSEVFSTLDNSNKSDRELELEEILRSALSISEREGEETNWRSFSKRIRHVLDIEPPITAASVAAEIQFHCLSLRSSDNFARPKVIRRLYNELGVLIDRWEQLNAEH